MIHDQQAPPDTARHLQGFDCLDDEVAIERSRYTRALSIQLKHLYDSAKAKGQPIPVDISENLEELKLQPVVSRQTLPRTVIHKIYPPSIAPIESLQLTTINKLQSHTVHRGKYLLVYTLAPATAHTKLRGAKKQVRNTYCYMPIFDKSIEHEKMGAFLELHNCFIRKPLDELLPRGTTIRIKEPFYTLCTSTSTNILLVRVDHPSDIEILYPFAADKPQSHWKKLGDVAFGLKRYYEAAAWYTKGINLANEQSGSINIRSNRAAAMLELGKYDACIEDCDAILKKQVNFKAQYRRAKAYYKLHGGRINDSHFIDYCVENPANVTGAVEDLLRGLEMRLTENNGTYTWADLQKEALTSDYLDRNDYDSPLVEIVAKEGKGNAVVALEKIKIGTLISVSKACAIVYDDDKDGVSSIRIDTVHDRCDRGEANELAPLLTQYVYENLTRKEPIYSLYAGPEYDNTLFVDDESVDAFRMHGIQVHNSFESEATEIQLSALPTRRSTRLHKPSTGIWAFPSFFNHSCLNNCTRLFLKDILIIKAARNIEAGEELTLGYVNKLHDVYERQATCHDFGFTCVCELCEIDKAELSKFPEEMLHREKLEEEYQKQGVAAMLKGSLTVQEMQKMRETTATLVFRLRTSYDKTGRTQMRYGLLRPLNVLCTISVQLKDWQFAMTAAKLMSELSPPTHAVDDLHLGVHTLIVALHFKHSIKDPTEPHAALDESLATVVEAWQIRGLVTGFGGFWEEFGEYFVTFLELSNAKERLEKVRQRILRAFLNALMLLSPPSTTR